MNSQFFEVDNVFASYDHIRVLEGVTLSVEQGTLVSLVGRNGAGKSTLLKVISGVLPLENGRVAFGGVDISNKSYVDVVKMGIVQVPQERKVFSGLTVLDSLWLGGSVHGRSKKEMKGAIQKVFELFPALADREQQKAGTLSGGQQQMLAIGQALAAAPRMLLLDEPSHGLAPLVVQELFRVIRQLVADGLSILLVEQNVRIALSISHKAFVMQGGKVVLSGVGAELLSSPDLKDAFIGKSKVDAEN